jgi:hypothetical protein
MRSGLTDRFNAAIATRKFGSRDTGEGRAYVGKYVTFIHYVEGLYEAATRRVEGHYPEGDARAREEHAHQVCGRRDHPAATHGLSDRYVVFEPTSAIVVRFSFFLTQAICMLWMGSFVALHAA